MLAAKAALRIADENLQGYRKTVDLSKARLDAGDISATDFERIDLQLAEFESDYDNAKLNLDPGKRPVATACSALTSRQTPSTLPARSTRLRSPRLSRKSSRKRCNRALTILPHSSPFVWPIPTSNWRTQTAPPIPPSAANTSASAPITALDFRSASRCGIFDRNQGEKQRTRYEAQSSRFAETAARNQVINDVDQAWAGYEPR